MKIQNSPTAYCGLQTADCRLLTADCKKQD